MSDDFFSQGYDPFENPVVERPYTKGKFKRQNNDEENIEDATYTVEAETDSSNSNSGGSKSDFDAVAEEVTSDFEEEIPEPNFDDNEEDEIEDAEFEDSGDSDSGKLGGENLKDLSPKQKRKAAEDTADAILSVYGQVTPLIYKNYAKFNERKLQKLQRNGDIDLSLKTGEGITAAEHIKTHNEFVDESFEMDDEIREEIKEPLVEVLMEQGLALTPTQKLIFAVGKHQVTLISATYQLNRSNKQFIEDMIEVTQYKKIQSIKKNKAIKSEKKKVDYSTIMNMPLNHQEEAKNIMAELGFDDDDDELVDVDVEETAET